MLRLQARNKLRARPTPFLKKMWDRYQVKKYGAKTVAINKARGTHRKELWKQRVGLIAYGQKRGLTA